MPRGRAPVRKPHQSREGTALHATDKVEIGRTDLHVTRLGLGGVALSGAQPATDPHQTTAEAEAVALIQRSLGLGHNYLDRPRCTALAIAKGGMARPCAVAPAESYVLATKVGRVLRPSEPGSAQMAWEFDFSQHGVRTVVCRIARTAGPGVHGYPLRA